MRLSPNVAIIAAAGARKTQTVIDAALADPAQRVLITTYTNENLRQIAMRIEQINGVVPAHVRIAGWFSFLLSDGVRPYQSALFNEVGVVAGLNFIGQRNRFAKGGTREYFIDRNHDVYRDGVSDLVCKLDTKSAGRVIRRLEAIYDHIYIDEVQDLVGYDLDFLDLLFGSKIAITVVGDPRQHTFATNNGPKNKRYRGAGLIDWLQERAAVCEREDRAVSHRCNQEICDFASALFPQFPAITSAHETVTGHDGIQFVSRFEVLDYAHTHRPEVLRYDKRANTQGLPAINFGVSKGSTYDRVLIFPTKPIREYLEHRDPAKLKRPEALYVAVTRARFSVAFVE
jgi:DNA helicase-2/ATP-dependent DNA helicase PcrA